jgi:hypothetical protein
VITMILNCKECENNQSLNNIYFPMEICLFGK